jgi:hypothetical protein
MNTAFAAGTFFLPSTIERFGRRAIMLYSAVGIMICLLIFVVMVNIPNKTTATQWTAVAFISLYNFILCYGWVGIPWL